MTPDELSAVTASVEKQIEVTVSGKIRVIDAKVDKIHTVLEKQNERMDLFTTKIDAHNRQHEIDMAEIRPFLQGAAGLKIVRDFAVWVGGLAIAYLAFKNSLKF